MSGNFCIDCSGQLIATTAVGVYEHASRTPCNHRLLNNRGFSVDHFYEVIDGVIYEIEGVEAHPEQGPCNREGPHGACSFCCDIMLEQMRAADARQKELEKKRRENTLIAGDDGASIGKTVTSPSPLLVDEPPADDNEPRLVPLVLKPRKVVKPSFTVTLDFEGAYPWRLYEEALAEIFEKAGVPRLGGASGTMGWSSFSTFQRCPYLWKRSYLDGVREDQPAAGEPKARVIGSAVHTYLALHYQKMIDAQFPLTPDDVDLQLRAMGCNPEYLDEAWRYFVAYRHYYMLEPLTPMAVEYLCVDTKSGESCRYDMIARLDRTHGALAEGTYIVEHKTIPRFGDVERTGWYGDGEIIGQAMLWRRMKLDRKFGRLQGVLINLIAKLKEPEFERINVAVMPWQIKAHARDLNQTHALRNLFISLNSFPRYRANCIGRYGKCSLFSSCADADRDEQ